MKLSTRTRFGLRIMLQIAEEGHRGPVFARRIADTQGISQAYVDQILLPLRTGGLLKSVRGRRGGYLLGRDASKITVLDVLETLEGPLNLVECIGDARACDRSKSCATRQVWADTSTALRETLADVDLAQLKTNHQTLLAGADFVI